MELESPRAPHQRFKWYVIGEALLDGPSFAAKYAAADGAERLRELWEAANREFPADERLDADGLALEVHGDASSPIVFVMPPPPQARNEAFSIALIPGAGAPVQYRAFALEKAVFPQTGAPLVFLVETDRNRRRNFGPPNDDASNDASRDAFVTAILQICDGTREPMGVTAIELVDPAPSLAKLRASHN
jgi:hypothetical protein